MSSLKKNLGYQTIYQILSTCLPLITSPYLARALGANQQGVFSYTLSIANYFTLFAMLGVTNYGSRSVAACGNNKERRSGVFWNIYIFQLITSFFSVAVYVLYLIYICKQNKCVAALEIFYIAAALIDINWVFFGVEKFDITVKRNIVVKVLSVILILTLVKKPDDLWKYALIMGGSVFTTNFVLLFQLNRIIDLTPKKYIVIKKIIRGIRPNVLLFLPLLAMSVYHIMDKTMLGLLSTYEQTGFYYNADKIINIPIGIISGFGTVMLPRMTALMKSNRRDDYNNLFEYSSNMIVAVTIALAMGISSISREFTPIFFGKGFEPCVELIIALSPVLLIKGLSQTVRMQFLIPLHKEKIYIEAVCMGAGINLILNYIFIINMGALGAVIATLAAELITCIWQYFKIRKEYKISSLVKEVLIYLGMGTIMFIGVRFVAHYITLSIVGLIVEILIGIIIYSVLCLIYWKKTNNPIEKEFRTLILKKIGKK